MNSKQTEEILSLFKEFMPDNINVEDKKQMAMYTAYHKLKEQSLPSNPVGDVEEMAKEYANRSYPPREQHDYETEYDYHKMIGEREQVRLHFIAGGHSIVRKMIDVLSRQRSKAQERYSHFNEVGDNHKQSLYEGKAKAYDDILIWLMDFENSNQSTNDIDHEAEKEVIMEAFDKVYKMFQSRSWIMEGRGSYRYDDDRYKEEVRYLFDEFDALHNETWKNIKSKSADFRRKVIEQYKKDLQNQYINHSESGYAAAPQKGMKKDADVWNELYDELDEKARHVDAYECGLPFSAKDSIIRELAVRYRLTKSPSPSEAGDGWDDEDWIKFIQWYAGMNRSSVLQGINQYKSQTPDQ